MPPYPDKEAKGSPPSADYDPASARVTANPTPNSHACNNPKTESLPHAAVQAALALASPYISGDSDSDDEYPPLADSTPVHPQSLNNMQPQTGTGPAAQSANKLSKSDTATPDHSGDSLPAPQNSENIHTKAGSSARPENTLGAEGAMHINDSTDQNQIDAATSDRENSVPKTEDNGAETTSQSPDCIAPANTEQGSPADPADPANADSVTVSKTCLDEVVEHLSNRISELESIRERKRARIERLSSAAYLAQSSAMALWPQTAAAAQRALGAQVPGLVPGAGLGLLSGAIPGRASSRNGAPFLHGALDAAGAIAGITGPVAPPPPPPPPPADAADRKQSRYWTADEHQRFLAAIETCGPKNYVQIAEIVGTRNAKQVRTHAQKFQKKLEREEAKRREDLQRHGAHPGAPAMSAAAVAAVAAAAAAINQSSAAARHLTAESSGHGRFAPQMLLPFQVAGSESARGPFAGAFPIAPLHAQHSTDGSSSTNNAFNDALAGSSPQNAAIAAVAAEAAALGGRVASAQMASAAQNRGTVVHQASGAGRASNAGSGKSAEILVTAPKAVEENTVVKSEENHTAERQTQDAKGARSSRRLEGGPIESTSEVGGSVFKDGEVSKNSNSVQSRRSKGTEKDGDLQLSGAQGGAVNGNEKALHQGVGDNVVRFRSCDELSGICDAVKQDLLNSNSGRANVLVTPDSDAVMKDSNVRKPASSIDTRRPTSKVAARGDDGRKSSGT